LFGPDGILIDSSCSGFGSFARIDTTLDQTGTHSILVYDQNNDQTMAYGLSYQCIGDCPTIPGCYIDFNLNINNQTLNTAEIFEACNTITAGPAVTITATGDVLFQAGRRVILKPGFSVEDGGRLSVVIDPSTGSLP
jgi:hypothetical protein